MIERLVFRLMPAVVGLALCLLLAGCSTGGGGEALSPTLSARMDQPGAAFNRVDALYMINDFRTARGVPPLRGDSVLEASAQSLASIYSKSGIAPPLPKGIDQILESDAHPDFVSTFNQWKSDPSSAAILADPTLGRAGLGIVFDATTGTSVYWVLLFGR